MLPRIFLLVFLANTVFGQISDSFTSTVLSGIWSGERNSFNVNNGFLESNGPSTSGGNIFLSTSLSGFNNVEWKFLVNLKFAPSSTNYLRFYLNSSLPTLNTTSLSGYYVQIGETNQDTIKLFRQIGNVRTKILSSNRVCITSSSANFSNVKVKVLRDSIGNWNLSTDCSGGENYVLDGIIKDNTYSVPGFFGPNCIYSTASRYNLFQLDDISVIPLGFDFTPPIVYNLKVVNERSIQISFSEPIDLTASTNLSNFIWTNNQSNPQTVISIDSKTVQLNFSSAFPSFTNQEISISGIKDLNGNTILSTKQVFLFTPTIPVVSEDFSDGNLNLNPVWNGSSESWLVENEKLRSISTIPNSAFYISTPFNRSGPTEWEWNQTLEFNPSSANYTDIYLISDNSNLTSSTLSGYFVRVGNTSDDISLYKITNGSNQLLINGRDGTLNSSLNNLKVKVVRDGNYNWELFTDITGTSDAYVSEGVIQDSTFKSSVAFGIKVQQSTASFFAKHFFDNIYAGLVQVDSIPPTLLSTIVLDKQSIELTFSEKLDTIFVKTPTIFKLNNISTLVEVKVLSTRKVKLKFNDLFASGFLNSLQINGLKDAVGNELTTTTSFIYTAPFRLNYRDLVFNEIYADESPSNGLPDTEFLEIFNKTTQNIDLKGFTIKDGTVNRVFNQNFTIVGMSYLVVCSSNTNAELLKSYDPSISVATLSGLSLTNGGDNLQLIDNYGQLIDKVSYNLDWYQDAEKSTGGWSFEQINPFFPCQNSNNWKASNALDGGTLGKLNSIYSSLPDTSAPRIVGMKQIAGTLWALTFSEPVDTNSFAINSFKLNNGLVINSIDSLFTDGTGIYLQFDKIPVLGKINSLKAFKISDCNGNKLDSTKISFGLGRKPERFELVISELLADETPTVGLPESEFLELYNTTNDLISLDSLELWDQTSFTRIYKESILPNEYIVLTSSTNVSKYSPFGKTIGLSNFPSLNNTGEKISLKSKNGTIIHSVNYTDTWYGSETKKNGGWSLEMMDPTNPCAKENNWSASIDSKGGTPGFQNSIKKSNPDLLSPFIKNAYSIDSASALIQLNESLDSLNTGLPVFTSENALSNWKYSSAEQNGLELHFIESFKTNSLVTITTSGLTDCKGNASPTIGTFVVPSIANKGDLKINEVLFNPYTGGADFVEIYNPSSNYYDLKGWKLANAQYDSVSNKKVIAEESFLIQPFQYLVLTSDSQNIKNNYPKSVGKAFLEMTSMPSFNDDEGTIFLLLPNDTVNERFDYSEKIHFKLLDDKEGVSLERISSDLPSNQPTSWHSTASNIGYATPGFINSQSTLSISYSDPFFVNPESFTPDGDGGRDFVLLTYQFPKSGQVANINIYDPKGRKVRTLAKNELLAVEGSYQWDGLDDGGRKASIGVYLIHAEIFDLEGKSKVYIKKVAVGAKF